MQYLLKLIVKYKLDILQEQRFRMMYFADCVGEKLIVIEEENMLKVRNKKNSMKQTNFLSWFSWLSFMWLFDSFFFFLGDFVSQHFSTYEI